MHPQGTAGQSLRAQGRPWLARSSTDGEYGMPSERVSLGVFNSICMYKIRFHNVIQSIALTVWNRLKTGKVTILIRHSFMSPEGLEQTPKHGVFWRSPPNYD